MPAATPLRLLLLEDNDSDEALVLTRLRRGGFAPAVERVETRAAFADALTRGPWDLIIADFALPSFTGMEALQLYSTSGLDVPFILVSGTVGEEIAVDSMKAGAHDYLLKDNLVRLVPAVKREIREAAERRARRQAEQALRESVELFSRAFRASPDAMVIVELESRRIVAVNDSNETLFGFAREAVVDRPATEADTWGNPADFDRLVELIRAQGAVRDMEITRRHRRGDPIVTLHSAEALDFGGRRCAVVVIHDITQWRQAQKAKAELEGQLLQAQKLETIGTLAGGIAHDLNNILTAIMGNAELARMELPPVHPAREHLEQTLLASTRARDLVNQILMFSRRKEQRREPMLLSDCVQEALKMLRASLPASISIHPSLPEDLPVIMADSTQVLQVIINLATNAANAMGSGAGRLELAVDAVHVDEEMARQQPLLRPGAFVRLRVTDNGCGMDAKVLEHIFEPFFTTKVEGQGTGLGLSIVHGVVMQHEGMIVVYSVPGQGTSFQLYFPQWRGGVSRPRTAPTELPAGRGQRLLLVDDEVMVVKVAEKILRVSGYQVVSFNDPGAALAAFRAEPGLFDLVVTDLSMPRMNGTRLAAEIWRTRPGIPILLSTGFTGNLETDQLIALGLRGPLLKPFSSEALLGAVATALA